MTITNTENKIITAGGNVEAFWKWMRGQTMGMDLDGETIVYDDDVERFIRYGCDAKKEPMVEFD